MRKRPPPLPRGPKEHEQLSSDSPETPGEAPTGGSSMDAFIDNALLLMSGQRYDIWDSYTCAPDRLRSLHPRRV